MPVIDVIGIDHVYVSVRDLEASERFYDRVFVETFAFRKNEFVIGGDRHVQYFNRDFGFVLRPARVDAGHEPYAPGLHHFCLRVDSAADVHRTVEELRKRGVDASPATLFPEYAHDYTATFFEDPDGVRLEVTNYRKERRDRHDHWDDLNVSSGG